MDDVIDVKQYINQLLTLDFKEEQKAWYNWFLKNGVQFTAEDRDKEREKEIISVEFLDLKPKECYYNSIVLASLEKGLEYYDGYYMTETFPIPFEHAWAVDENGHVIDVTAYVAGIEVKEYFGIQIPFDYVFQFISKTDTATWLAPRYYHEKEVIQKRC